MFCFGLYAPTLSPTLLSVSGAQLAASIDDPAVTGEDVREDADVSRPVRNLHDFTGACRATVRLPPLQIPHRVSSCSSAVQLLSRGMPE